jgi:hypothetical protein
MKHLGSLLILLVMLLAAGRLLAISTSTCGT